ncbi:presequence protease [Babesia gibsoni]|uniref:Presequence protease n=1 Tax=Babesia gibsoni TaxID=33632 RepID=A0AAD8PD37_BABGI|nr:presequence protease [Babesia gibsoni]
MLLKRRCNSQGILFISASLTSVGFLGCLYGKILSLPLGIQAFNIEERYKSVCSLRDSPLRFSTFRHSPSRIGWIHKVQDSDSLCSTHLALPSGSTSSSGQTGSDTMEQNCETPEWAASAFSVTHESFDKVNDEFIADLSLAASLYKHKLTGISVISLVTDVSSGREMCFDIVVPTPPFDDTGCPHILEHSVLAGSKSYPSKAGFALLLQGGFQSFANAFTYKDRTSYLFASTNEKDFYNTAHFFMSSVFHPIIRHSEDVFKQEAWHYKVLYKGDQENVYDDDGITLHNHHISYGGIVYSEMRKAYSDPVSRAEDYICQSLFTNSYKFDSGGNPKNIVQLTYPELVKFYETYYSPKTSNIYFYGPDDPRKRLAFVEEYLRENGISSGDSFYNANMDTAYSYIRPEAYRELGNLITGSFGSAGKEEDMIFTGWLLDPLYIDPKSKENTKSHFEMDEVDALGMEVLEYLLIGTPESLLYKALIKSQLGNKIVGSGLTNDYNQSYFIAGLSGIDCKDALSKQEARVKFENVVMLTLEDIVQKGIKKDAVDAALNNIEFKLRELNTGSFPKGLMLVNIIQSHKQYNKDPLAALHFGDLIKQLREKIKKDEAYFSKLVKKHLVDNKHKVTVHMNAMNPQEFEKESNETIKKSLMERLGHLREEDVKAMESEYRSYKAEREEPEDPKVLEALPVLSLDDINKTNEIIPTLYYLLGNPSSFESMPKPCLNEIIALCHPIESSGIVYLDLAISLEDLNLEEIKYLDIFTAMLKEAGTQEMDPEAMTYHISKNLGSLEANFSFMTASNGRRYSHRNDALGYLYIRAKALDGKKNEMLDIVLDVLKNANFSNKEKGMEIIKRSINQMESDMISKGHIFAGRRLMSSLSVADYATEVSSGYEYLHALKGEIKSRAEEHWSNISSMLENIRNKVLVTKNLIVNVTASSQISKAWLEEEGGAISQKLELTFKPGQKNEKIAPWVSESISREYFHRKNEVIVVPTNVNFVGMGGSLFNEDELNGADGLVIHYLSSSYLWKQIRMSLGAYGVFCNLSACGDIVFMSYADPNFEKTLKVYMDSPMAIEEEFKSFSDKELLRQKVGKLSHIDKPLTVDAKGLLSMNRIIRGETDENRQLYREDIMQASLECFKRLVDRMKCSREWHNVCAVINRTTAAALPSTITQLDILKLDS